MRLLAAFAAFALPALALAAVPLTDQRLFGHSVKNGPLPPNTEVTAFEHTCREPPCVITQIHCPSIYPGQGDAWNWTAGLLSFYVDGDAAPTISVTLAELGGEDRFAEPDAHADSKVPKDGSPWGVGMMGRTAKSGGVYSTVRLPFGRSIKITIRAASAARSQSIYWLIVRGLESHAVILGDLELPAAARLKLHRVPPTRVSDLKLITLAKVSSGTAGALLRVNFAASGPDYGYLEACLRFFPDGAEEPLFLSSGAEDYFLSASYFDEGMFKTPNSGLTYYDGNGTLSVYKTHDRDPIVWRDGMTLVFRAGENTGGCGDCEHCPDQYCPPNATDAKFNRKVQSQLVKDLSRRRREINEERERRNGEEYSPTPTVVYNTLVWVYEWPTSTADGGHMTSSKTEAAAAASTITSSVRAAKLLRLLADAGHLSEEEEDEFVDLVLRQDVSVLTLLSAFGDSDSDETDAPAIGFNDARRLARHLRRQLQVPKEEV